MAANSEQAGPAAANRQFATTRWSVVLAAGDRGSAGATAALELLCGTYWFPLYAYARRQVTAVDDAQDLTQAFFARLLENICLKCLEKSQLRRYGSAADLVADLVRFLQRQPVLARRAGLARRIWSAARRRPWLIAAISSLAFLCVLTVAYWQWSENAFLRYKTDCPDMIVQPGLRTEHSLFLYNINCIIFGLVATVTAALKWWTSKTRRQQARVSAGLLQFCGIISAVGGFSPAGIF